MKPRTHLYKFGSWRWWCGFPWALFWGKANSRHNWLLKLFWVHRITSSSSRLVSFWFFFFFLTKWLHYKIWNQNFLPTCVGKTYTDNLHYHLLWNTLTRISGNFKVPILRCKSQLLSTKATYFSNAVYELIQ